MIANIMLFTLATPHIHNSHILDWEHDWSERYVRAFDQQLQRKRRLEATVCHNLFTKIRGWDCSEAFYNIFEGIAWPQVVNVADLTRLRT